MESAEKAEKNAAGQKNRRAVPRYDVEEEAHLLLVKHGSTVPCRMVDLSLGGCRVRTKERFSAGIMVRVEVCFMVRGLAFRFSGVTQWTQGQHLVGIRFVDVAARRRNELAEALAEIKDHIAVQADEPATAAVAEELTAEKPVAVLKAAMAPVAVLADRRLPEKRPAERPISLPPAPLKAEVPPVGSPPKPAGKERRAQSRQEVDTSAVIDLIRIGSKLSGRILDLSLSGCRIRTDERFPVGIYTRVETEFRLEGLPFRLGGVVQAIHDSYAVGIRFLDVSHRKREQVEQLIQEIQEQGTRDRE